MSYFKRSKVGESFQEESLAYHIQSLGNNRELNCVEGRRLPGATENFSIRLDKEGLLRSILVLFPAWRARQAFSRVSAWISLLMSLEEPSPIIPKLTSS
jgi:hypothetical protein